MMKKVKLLFSGLLLLSSLTLFAQQTVTGVVTEKSTGETLPGVGVLVKGTTKGIETDFDGKFRLENLKPSDVLVFSYLGFKTEEITIGTQKVINIALSEDGQILDEVVVVGYGTTTVKDATGSVEAITSKEFTKGNIVTPENLLSGRIAGVSINTSGAPGSGSAIRIRGGSSINASNDPLIIIDGLPIDNTGSEGSRGVLASINPNDIESFSVLKDASSTAIYGSRASNGVIIITTKKGKQDFTLDIDTQYTMGSISNRIDVFSADAFRKLIADKYPDRVGNLGTANTNWSDQVLRSTLSTQSNITTRGTLLNMLPVRLSLGFSEIEGALKTSNFERKNASISLSPTILDDHLKINVNYNIAFEDSRFADGGIINQALRYDPTAPVYDPSSPFGKYYQHRNGDVIANGGKNPLANLEQRNNLGDSFRHYGNLKLDYKMPFLTDLHAVINVGFDKTKSSRNDVFSPLAATTDPDRLFIGSEETVNQELTNKLLDGYLNYKTDLTEKVNVDLTAGYSYQRFQNTKNGTGNIRDTKSKAFIDNQPDVVLIGFFGRANFSLFDKYLVTLNYRRDGTSRFSKKNRWGDFPGAALAWKVSEENFLKESNVVSNLKLRASWGLTGQQDVFEKDIFLSRYRSGNPNSQYLFGGNPIIPFVASPINEDLKWEETSTIEVGVDYGLFDNRISGALGVFKKNSTDLLFSAATANNFTNRIIQNIGELEIKGLEFSVNADILREEDYNWSVNFNTTFLDRKIAKLADGNDVETGGISGGTGTNVQLFREGESPNSFYVYKQLYDANGTAIEGAYADLNGDGIVNESDRYLKDNPNADAIFGFQSNFNYKNFDFSFNMRANVGNHAYNNVNSSSAQYSLLLDQSVLGNLPTAVLNTNFINTSDVILSDLYVENASFLKMDNITLGYTFDKPIPGLEKNSIRIWAGMQNVFTITNYSGLDPEVFNGIDNTTYPRPRNFLIGANIKF